MRPENDIRRIVTLLAATAAVLALLAPTAAAGERIVTYGFIQKTTIPEVWPDLDGIKGFDAVLIVCHPRDLTPKFGEYDFEWLQRQLDLAGALGLKAVVTIFTAGNDSWFPTWPEWWKERFRYVEVPWIEKKGMQLIPAYWDQPFKDYWTELLRKWAAFCDAHPACIAVRIPMASWGEPSILPEDAPLESIGYTDAGYIDYIDKCIAAVVDSSPGLDHLFTVGCPKTGGKYRDVVWQQGLDMAAARGCLLGWHGIVSEAASWSEDTRGAWHGAGANSPLNRVWDKAKELGLGLHFEERTPKEMGSPKSAKDLQAIWDHVDKLAGDRKVYYVARDDNLTRYRKDFPEMALEWKQKNSSGGTDQ
jgi:hypothetical protein